MAKLMLVEDDNNLREIYEARLRAEGYDIVAARDGEEALVVAKSEKPDLIIADIMMPKISGFEMLDILRNTAELKDVKVIMLTALGQSDDQQRANSLGADRYLVKSQVTLEDIIKVVHELLGDGQAAEPAAPASPEAPASPPAPAAPAEPPAAVEPAPAEAPAAPAAEEPPAPPTEAPAAPAATSIPVTEPPEDDDAAAASAEPVDPPSPAEPPTDAPSDDSPVTDDAQDDAPSAAQEEAGVESQIEDFVAGATEEASAPAAAPETAAASEEPVVVPDTPAAETSTAPAPEPEAPQPQEEEASEPTKSPADVANDDKLVADAAQALIDSTETVEEDAASGEPTTFKPEPAPSETVPKAEAAAEDTSNGNVPIAHKKVITPLDDHPKQDINTLLAMEEAKEASDNPATGNTIKPSAPAANNQADPGSIAL